MGTSGIRGALWSANVITVIGLVCLLSATAAGAERTITDSSPLDNLIIRPLFHKFRNFTFGIVGPTSLLNRSGKFYQSPLRFFPCDTSFGRSPEPPTSVHKLRPGKTPTTSFSSFFPCTLCHYASSERGLVGGYLMGLFRVQPATSGRHSGSHDRNLTWWMAIATVDCRATETKRHLG